MRYTLPLAALAALFTASSCNSGAGESKAVSTPINTPNVTVPNAPVTGPATTSTTTTPVVTTTPVTTTPVVNNTTAPVTVASGMNPNHGEPGHRCDIPVGAPLSTPPQAPKMSTSSAPVTTTTAPSVQSSPITTNTAPVINTTPVTSTAPGMNPAHGQPGHRCDIAVGAPLNSKPVTTTLPAPKQ